MTTRDDGTDDEETISNQRKLSIWVCTMASPLCARLGHSLQHSYLPSLCDANCFATFNYDVLRK